MGVAACAHRVRQQHPVQPGMDNAVARTQGYAAPGHDEVGEAVLGVDIHRLGVGRRVAERLHGQIGGEAEAGQVFQLVTGHGAGGVLAAHGGHFRFAVGAGTNAVDTTGAAYHLLCQGIALAGILGLLRRPEQLGLGQAQRLAGAGGEPAADDQVDAAAGAHLVQQHLGFQAEFTEGGTLVVENFAVVGADFDHLAHFQLIHVRFEDQRARIFHGVVENRRDLAADADAAGFLVGHAGHVLPEEPQH